MKTFLLNYQKLTVNKEKEDREVKQTSLVTWWKKKNNTLIRPILTLLKNRNLCFRQRSQIKVNFYEFYRLKFRVFLLLTCFFTKVKKPSLPYYLPIAGEWIVGWIPFQRILAKCEMQRTLSRISSLIAVSIFYDNKPYIASASLTCLIKTFSSKIENSIIFTMALQTFISE